MVFQRRAGNLLAVVEIFRADETHDRIDQQRRISTRYGVGTGFERLLIHTVMGIRRQRRALSGLEVHDIRANAVPPQGQRSLLTFAQHRQIDTETAIGRLGARDRLEHQIHRGVALNGFNGIADVREHAALRGNGIVLAQFVDALQ